MTVVSCSDEAQQAGTQHPFHSSVPPSESTNQHVIYRALPYLVAKMFVAGYMAYIEHIFGSIGGSAVEGEADSLHSLYLWMGLGMGGLRTVGILASMTHVPQTPSPHNRVGRVADDRHDEHDDEEDSRSGCGTTSCTAFMCFPVGAGSYTKQYIKSHPACNDNRTRDDEGTSTSDAVRAPLLIQQTDASAALTSPQLPPLRLHETILVSSVVTIVFSTFASVGLYNARYVVRMIAKDTSPALLDVVEAFGRGFWWGSHPTLLLYNKEQQMLARGYPMLPLVYGGVLYAFVGVATAYWWTRDATSSSSAAPSGQIACSGVRALGQSLALAGWVSYGAIKVHLWCVVWWHSSMKSTTRRGDQEQTRRDDEQQVTLPLFHSEQVVWRIFRSNTNHAATDNDLNVVACSWKSWYGPISRFLALSVPMALSNGTGLVRQLVVAATTGPCTTSAASAYSISDAYFSTSDMVLLGMSSVVGALVAQNDTTTSRIVHSRRTSHRRYELRASILVLLFAAVLCVPPVAASQLIGHVFGSSVFGYDDSSVDAVQDELVSFNVLGAAAFFLAAVSMVLSATVHARLTVWMPLLVGCISNACGVAWALVWSDVGAGQHCSLRVGGSLVAAAISVLGMIVLRRRLVT